MVATDTHLPALALRRRIPCSRMNRLAHKFWIWALVQGLIALLIVGWRFYVGRADYLLHSLDGHSYHFTWSFHSTGFLAYSLLFLGGVGVLIGLEWFVARKISKRQIGNEKLAA